MHKVSIHPVLVLLFFCVSCTTVSYSTRISTPGFNIKDLLEKKVEVVFGNELNQDAYQKAFNKKFSNTDGYFKWLQGKYVASLKQLNQKVSKGSSISLSGIYGVSGINQDAIRKAEAYFENTEAELVLFIQRADIRREVVTGYVAPAQPGMMGSHNSSESCIVKLTLSVWDPKSQKHLYEFSTTDKASVMFFSYQASLEGASMKAVESSISYIKKNGRVN